MKPPTSPMSKTSSVFVWSACALLLGCGTRMFLNTQVTVLDEHARAVLGGGGNSFVLLHGREAFVSDVKFLGYAHDLQRSVEEELGRAVRRVLLTHAHADHAGGLDAFSPAVVLVHPNARRRLEAAGVKAPWVEVEDEVVLFLGGEEVRVFAPGVGHTDGDLVAYLPGRKLLVAGDLIGDGLEPHVDASTGGDVRALEKTLEGLLALDFDAVVPGHGAVMTRGQAQAQVDYLHALEQAVRVSLGRGRTEEQTVDEVTLPQYALEEIPFSKDRQKNVRGMFRALGAEGMRAW
jgi:cyclase